MTPEARRIARELRKAGMSDLADDVQSLKRGLARTRVQIVLNLVDPRPSPKWVIDAGRILGVYPYN